MKKKKYLNSHPLGYLGLLINRFTATKEVDRSLITTRPDLFQNRQGAFSQETVNKILSEGFDKSQEPIAVWWDEKAHKYEVISGHSRWHASEILYKQGETELQTMPVKVFNGSLEEARDYALLESNRSGTAENLKEDIAAYKRAIATGKTKKYLLSIFKTEGKIRMLEDFATLNPKGRFMEHLGEDSEKSFPYLQRNAQWTGMLRRLHPELTDSHEREMYEYLYANKAAVSVKKDVFFNLVEKKIGSMFLKPEKPLNLNNVASTSAYTNQTKERLSEINAEIEDLTAQRSKKETNIAKAEAEGKDNYVVRFTEERSLINQAILLRLSEKERIEKQIRDLEKSLHFDLFNPVPEPDEARVPVKKEVKVELEKPKHAPAPTKPAKPVLELTPPPAKPIKAKPKAKPGGKDYSAIRNMALMVMATLNELDKTASVKGLNGLKTIKQLEKTRLRRDFRLNNLDKKKTKIKRVIYDVNYSIGRDKYTESFGKELGEAEWFAYGLALEYIGREIKYEIVKVYLDNNGNIVKEETIKQDECYIPENPVLDEVEEHFGGKYSEHKGLKIRIANHSQISGRNGDVDLSVVIADKDPTFHRASSVTYSGEIKARESGVKNVYFNPNKHSSDEIIAFIEKWIDKNAL